MEEEEKEEKDLKKEKQKNYIKKKLKTKFEKEESVLSLKANLNNFSIWIPLRADNEKSQVLQLSFMSRFSMDQNSVINYEKEMEFNAVVNAEKIESKY